MDWKTLEKKFTKGFRDVDISQEGVGLTNSEAVMLRAMKKKEGYDGMLAFFICKRYTIISKPKLQIAKKLSKHFIILLGKK